MPRLEIPESTRRVRLLTLACLAWIALGGVLHDAAADPAAAGFSSERLARIDARMEEARADGIMVGAQALLARHGEVFYQDSWGFADREAQTPMRDDTIFRIYSMSKPITSVAVLMLYEEGHFLLGDPIANYLPELADLMVLEPGSDEQRPAKRQPTIRDLLRHTAGFSYGLFGDTAVDRAYLEADLFVQPTLEDFTRVLGTLPLLHDPGERWHYSVSVDVQGRLVEVISGQSFGDFLRERIFTPLSMRDTSFRIAESKRPRLVQMYAPRGSVSGWASPWQFGDPSVLEPADPEISRPYYEETFFESGGAGLLSTMADYLRFAQMLANGGTLDGKRLLAPGTVEMMRSDHLQGLDSSDLWGLEGFGLGVGVASADAGRRGELDGSGRFGWGGAAGTDFWIDPETGLVGVLMVQSLPHQTQLRSLFRVLSYQALID